VEVNGSPKKKKLKSDPSEPETKVEEQSIRKKKKESSQPETEVKAEQQIKKKKKKLKKMAGVPEQKMEKKKKKVDVEAEFSMSSERLKSYGLNPKKLKKKLFHKKMIKNE